MRVKVTPALLDRLTACRITTAVEGERWREGNILHVNPYGKIEGYCQFLVGPTVPRAFGAFSYSWSECDLALSVGRYCSISLGVQLMGSPHPSSWASTSPFSYGSTPRRPFDEYLADVGNKSAPLLAFDEGVRWVQIGNDVWIGAQAMIKRGVTIGNGAVIGARSIVTHDVPPYAVVAGAPARIIRYRFEESLIERFTRLAWWRFGPEVLQPLDVSVPARFLDRLEERIAAGLAPAQLPLLTGREIIAAGEPL